MYRTPSFRHNIVYTLLLAVGFSVCTPTQTATGPTYILNYLIGNSLVNLITSLDMDDDSEVTEIIRNTLSRHNIDPHQFTYTVKRNLAFFNTILPTLTQDIFLSDSNLLRLLDEKERDSTILQAGVSSLEKHAEHQLIYHICSTLISFVCLNRDTAAPMGFLEWYLVGCLYHYCAYRADLGAAYLTDYETTRSALEQQRTIENPSYLFVRMWPNWFRNMVDMFHPTPENRMDLLQQNADYQAGKQRDIHHYISYAIGKKIYHIIDTLFFSPDQRLPIHD